MTQQDLRRECLHMAQNCLGMAHAGTDEIVARARAYMDFIDGTHDAEVVAAAKELAWKLARNSGEE